MARPSHSPLKSEPEILTHSRMCVITDRRHTQLMQTLSTARALDGRTRPDGARVLQGPARCLSFYVRCGTLGVCRTRWVRTYLFVGTGSPPIHNHAPVPIRVRMRIHPTTSIQEFPKGAFLASSSSSMHMHMRLRAQTSDLCVRDRETCTGKPATRITDR